MIIKTYTNKSDVNVCNKSLSNETEIEVRLLTDTEVIDPLIVLSGSINTFNYVYIPEFNRYYFADRPTNLNNNMFRVQLHCDRLMTFRNNIKNSKGYVLYSENLKNNYIHSSVWQPDVRDTTEQIPFVNPTDAFTENPSYVLITAGATI